MHSSYRQIVGSLGIPQTNELCQARCDPHPKDERQRYGRASRELYLNESPGSSLRGQP
jgi:hypothetical protein